MKERTVSWEGTMYGLKIFAGLTAYNVEYDFNSWAKEHEKIIIKEFKYRVNEAKGYSIAILYEER